MAAITYSPIIISVQEKSLLELDFHQTIIALGIYKPQ